MKSSSIPMLALVLASNNQYTPTFPVGIISWIVCNSRKRNEYGGWLLYFYWQLYAGVFMAAIANAVTGPTPGCVINRTAAARRFTSSSTCWFRCHLLFNSSSVTSNCSRRAAA